MKIAVCDDDKGCLDSMKRLLAGYPGISRTEYYHDTVSPRRGLNDTGDILDVRKDVAADSQHKTAF